VRLCGFVEEFGEKYFTTDGKILFCKLCEVKVMFEKRFTVKQHCKAVKKKLRKQRIRRGKQTAIAV